MPNAVWQTHTNGTLGPYPGPRPFRTNETDLFFGRDRETAQLRSLILAHSLVLLYAPSGAGKTSLLRAGLIPALEEQEVTILPILRILPSNRDDMASGIKNPYVRSMVANWCADEGEPAVDIQNLPEFLKLVALRGSVGGDEARVLIIDQFEELFTHFPEHWESRGDFFAQMQDSLAADPELRVLLAIREDYLPQTDPYAASISNHLQHRFRIERLHREPALSAVSSPVSLTDRVFASGAAEYLVDQLLQIRVERDGRPVTVAGEYVEPVQLQIVCASLWERLEALPQKITKITKDHIRRYAPVDRALARFYGDLISRVAANSRLDPLELRRWCEDSLITPGGTRALVYRGRTATGGLQNTAVDDLEAEHLIRGEERAGAHWYELSHDKFIEAIQSGNRQAFEEQADAVSEFDTRTDTWRKQVIDAINELRSGDGTRQHTAIQTLFPVAFGSAPLWPDLRVALDDTLTQLTQDPTADEEVRRLAEQLQSLARHSEADFGDRLSSRRTAAYVRYLTVSGRVLLRDSVILAVGLLASLIGLSALTATLSGWDLFHELSHWYAIAGVAFVWTAVYVFETLDNFPLQSWRRSESQRIHTLTSPVAPYQSVHDRVGLKFLVGWPFSLLLPWGVAVGAATVTDNVFGWPVPSIFFPTLGGATLVTALIYLDNEV
ncbi:MAG TPA: ATP-binding protein [Solirubrobacteraceae bacterium]|nr:ATP-binding protein [Solirubrobacteraceae bacterium]